MARDFGLAARRFYALIWKDFVIHKRHFIWSLLEITIPVLVCAMAILSNSHQGKARLEEERTFDPDDYEKLYGELNPTRFRLLVAPNTTFTRALVDQIDNSSLRIELCNTENELVDLIRQEVPVSLNQIKRLLPSDDDNVTIGGVVIQSDESYRKVKLQDLGGPSVAASTKLDKNNRKHKESINVSQKNNQKSSALYYEVMSKLEGKSMKIPINFEMGIRAKDFRLGIEPFPKKYSLGPFLHGDHYTSTFFMASQILLSRAYLNLLNQYVNSTGSPRPLKPTDPSTDGFVIPTDRDIIGQRMPYPKFVTHKRLKESTLGTFVAGSQKQKPFVLSMDYCLTVGFLVTAIFLAKRIVDEKKSRVRDMLRLVGISDWTYYGSHICNTMIIMIVQCAIITFLFTNPTDAPAQNTDPTLIFFILVIYCLSAIMFVLALSTLFSSSTKAIIFTSLFWLGLPEVLDRIFKLNSGVVESSGSIIVGESVHLTFSLMPNFGLRLMNRLLSECDIYGEFYEKKQLYGEFRAIWPNIWHPLPLYKFLTIGHVILAMLSAVPLYASLIYVINSTLSSPVGLASLTSEGGSDKQSASVGGLIKSIVIFVIRLLAAPFKLIQAIISNGKHQTSSRNETNTTGNVWSAANFNHSTPEVFILNSNKPSQNEAKGYTNAGFIGPDTQSKQKRDPKLNDLELTNYNGSLPDNKLTQVCEFDRSAKDESLRYFEQAPKILKIGISIRNLCKTFFTTSSKLRQIDAVKSVSLDMYYSQILVLLGHNGAGKTTLIDIISGHTQKSSGQILIDGYDIDTHPNEARRKVGFCPQFDVLFERLTVREHLYFYGIVKGARSELKGEIEQLLQQSGLDVHEKKLSKNLSGGYKRKLSLAIAMIAKSKVLILDEPTSGMDPESRRKVWDFLQIIRHDRLILMTTHHMEEADALGDRIAVMSSGQVKCCGSALFLKRIFDAGYHLRISKGVNWNQVGFDELIGIKYNLEDKLENLTPHELMYMFDASDTSSILPRLFDDLEKYKEQVGIFGFGITVSTMDDVFMKIGLHFHDVEAQEMQNKFQLVKKEQKVHKQQGPIISKLNKHQVLTIDSKPLGNSDKQAVSPCRRARLDGNNLFRQHMRALLAKRIQHAKKNWFQLLWIMSISLACVAAVVVLLDVVIFKEELIPEWTLPMTLEGAGYGSRTVGIYQHKPEIDEAAELEALRDAAFPSTELSLSSTTTSTSTELPATSSFSTILSDIASNGPSSGSSSAPTTLGAALSTDVFPKSDTTTSATPTTPSSLLASITTKATTSAGSDSNSAPEIRARRQTMTIRRSGRSWASPNASELFLKHYWYPEAQKGGVHELLTYTDINTQMIDLLTRQFANFREHYIVGGEKTGSKYIAWYNGEASHSLPISMNIMLNSILKQFTDLIQDNGHPLKGSRISLSHITMAKINTLIAFLPHLGRLINLVFLPFSLAFITSYFVMFPTHERVSKSKHLQLMTGVPMRIFWLSHFLFDFLFYAAYTVLVLGIYFVWDRVINDHQIYFANFEHSLALVILVTLFIFGALPLAYIFSFMAKKPTSAFSSFCVLTILTGTATLTLVSLYELKYEHSASAMFKIAFTIFLWTARLIPSVSLLIGLQKLFALNTTRAICINVSPDVLNLLCRYINSPLVDDELRVLRPERCCKSVCQDECFDQWPFFWTGWFGINVEIAMLAVDACLLWFILVLIESRSLRKALLKRLNAVSVLCSVGESLRKLRGYCWQVPQFATDDQNLSNDRLKSRRSVEQSRTHEYSLVANDLTKVYSSNKFKAVDKLSFTVDKQEFFGLLGVNGAGKSTTFKMLTGEIAATSGNAYIGPYNVQHSRRQYLKCIGYCPQQDALIENLTGAEMLKLFGRLRGVPEQFLNDLVEETLDKLGLKRMGHIDCNNYSGGNKRRLSVGMALIGAPEVVFLDEPTSGVDPRSRRRLWSTLIEFQREHQSAIVMTSHSMNECECLCDRVAIMVGGQFKVLGSIQYLRTKLARGFSLVLKLKPDHLVELRDVKKSSQKIHEYLAECFAPSKVELKDLHQSVLQYHIEPNDKFTWSVMLTTLERAKKDLDLEDYQITSDASLESIFLSLAKQ